MKMFITTAAVSLFVAGSSFAASDVAGDWVYVNPKNGSTSVLSISKCKDAMCGKVTSIVNKEGKDITAKAKEDNPKLKRMVFWDLRPNGDGRLEGKGYSANTDADYYVFDMRAEGGKILYQGCSDKEGFVCQDVEFKKK